MSAAVYFCPLLLAVHDVLSGRGRSLHLATPESLRKFVHTAEVEDTHQQGSIKRKRVFLTVIK